MSNIQTPTLRTRDMMTVDDLFIKDGYVLKFSDKTYGLFFREEVGVDIDDPKWSQEGGSKGKRLRYFLRNTTNALATKALKARFGNTGRCTAHANAPKRKSTTHMVDYWSC